MGVELAMLFLRQTHCLIKYNDACTVPQKQTDKRILFCCVFGTISFVVNGKWKRVNIMIKKFQKMCKVFAKFKMEAPSHITT